MDITLKKFDYDNEIETLKEIMNDEAIMYEFPDFRKFLISMHIKELYFIEFQNKKIGFIGLSKVGYEENYLFIDSGIIKEYRKKGYGKQALQTFISNYNYGNPLLIRTNKNNVAGNNAIMPFATFLIQLNDYNFYIVNECLKDKTIEEVSKHKELVLSNRNFIYNCARDHIKECY